MKKYKSLECCLSISKGNIAIGVSAVLTVNSHAAIKGFFSPPPFMDTRIKDIYKKIYIHYIFLYHIYGSIKKMGVNKYFEFITVPFWGFEKKKKVIQKCPSLKSRLESSIIYAEYEWRSWWCFRVDRNTESFTGTWSLGLQR